LIDAEIADDGALCFGIERRRAVRASRDAVTAAITEVFVDHSEAEPARVAERCHMDRARRAGRDAGRRFLLTIVVERRWALVAGVGKPETVEKPSLLGARIDAEESLLGPDSTGVMKR
jgi:hypothetical protein